MPDYAKIARESRKKVLDLIFRAQTSHIGSNFSCADIMAVLFEKIDLDKDKFVLSAGWKAAMLYYHLWRKDRITEDELNSYCQPGSKWIGLAEPACKEIIIAGGSMSMGLAGACGLALAKKIKGEDGRIFVLESDGGMNGGMVWESMAIAAQHRLDNLTMILDVNGYSAMGKTKDILDLEPLQDKFKAFGWNWVRVKGHNHELIDGALNTPHDVPLAIICDTIKGNPVSFMSGENIYHYKAPNREEYELALKELENAV